MSNIYQIIRFIYGRSPFRTIVILTLVALALIILSKVQIFKMELHSNDHIDQQPNPKIITPKKVFLQTSEGSVISVSTTTNVTNKMTTPELIVKKIETPGKIFSGLDVVIHNVSFNLIKENLIKVANNDILLKGLNEDSQKLHSSLNNKPLDYDKNARFCMCSKISQPCVCCVKLAEENIGLTKSLCSNITYLPKVKAARVSMQYGEFLRSNHDVLIDISSPPSVCLSEFIHYDNVVQEDGVGTGNFTLDVCFQPKNLTYNVDVDTSHRTEFKGCSNINVRLNGMMIHVYPMGCFKASHDHKELQIQRVANGIP